MRVLGADLRPEAPAPGAREISLVLLDEAGRVVSIRHPASIPELAASVVELAAGEPFLLGINLPVVVPERAGRVRPVENLVYRRMGFRLPHGGRTALVGAGGEALLAALAAAGHPCLPYPDRDRRTSGLAEIHAGLVLKVLLWEDSAAARGRDRREKEMIFRAFAPPQYRPSRRQARAAWAERAVAMDLLLRAIGNARQLDLRPAREALAAADTASDVDRAAAILDACLIAGAARLYLEDPEASLFLGDRQEGYVILPADGFVRRLALRDLRPGRAVLFPRGSLRARLGDAVEIRPAGLLDVPGRPQRIEAVFRDQPLYEFDNVDEMLWWKHCRHLAGPAIPIEGLQELVVMPGKETSPADAGGSFRLLRSRHRVLSFRFDPPEAWRARIPTRDGRTYPFRVARAIFETLPVEK